MTPRTTIQRTTRHPRRSKARSEYGFTLIEIMISMALSLVILSALVGLFVNSSRNNSTLLNTSSMIENGRFALQLLESDVIHAGFWNGYVPQFDNFNSTVIPGDVPAIVPDVCALFATWTHAYRTSLIGIPVQAYEALPSGAGCVGALSQHPRTDVLVVRHADTCVPGTANCDADIAGQLYMQASYCTAETRAGTIVAATGNTVTLNAGAAAVNDIYKGLTIRVGERLFNTVSTYNWLTKVATLTDVWPVAPAAGTPYAFEYVLGSNQFPLYQRDCVGTGSPPALPITAGTSAEKRRFSSNIYYVHDYPHPDRAGEVIPTLVRSQLDAVGGTQVQAEPVPLINGIEGFRVVLGIDNVSDSGAPVDYTASVVWADPNDKDSPTNRGDGEPDQFIRCTTAVPCTAAQLVNVVAVKLFVLARSREPVAGHTDSRRYCLGELNTAGACRPEDEVGPMDDSYERHLFTTSVRLMNVSARRETPP